MKKKLQNKIFNDFDNMYRERNLDMSKTCMCWGITTGNGWFDIIYQLSKDIQKELNENPYEHFAIIQVKEKFGALRFYVRGASEIIHKLISDAENKSSITCEECGKPGTLDNRFYWVLTLCDECKAKRNDSISIPVSKLQNKVIEARKNEDEKAEDKALIEIHNLERPLKKRNKISDEESQ